MPFLAIALIFWIAAGCFGAAFLADLDDGAKSLSEWQGKEQARLDAAGHRLDETDNVAYQARDIARAAKQAAEVNARSLTDHLEQVYAWRAAKEKAALQPSKPRRRAHDRDR